MKKKSEWLYTYTFTFDAKSTKIPEGSQRKGFPKSVLKTNGKNVKQNT